MQQVNRLIMATFFYAIVFSPPAFGPCNQGNTFIDLVQINNRSQAGTQVESFRLDDNACVFFNDTGFEVGLADEEVDVVIKAHVDTAAVGNRNFSFFMCSGGRQYDGPPESENNDGNGTITLKATYAVGQKVTGDCVAHLRSRLGAGTTAGAVAGNPAGTPAGSELAHVKSESSEKERTKQIIKRIVKL